MHVLSRVSHHEFHMYNISVSRTQLHKNNNCSVSNLADSRFSHTYVSVCSSGNTKAPKMIKESSGLAACLPPIYGSIGLSNITNFIEDHKKIGVQHFFIYFANCSNPLQYDLRNFRTETSLLCMPWVYDEVNIHQRGQIWHMNDCVHRAATVGWKWILLNDLDERLQASTDFLDSFAKYDVITFGSKVNNKTTCVDSRFKRNTDMCLRWGGWRKLIVRATNILSVHIHFGVNCLNHTNYSPKTCIVCNVPANKFWMNHQTHDDFNRRWYPNMPGIHVTRLKAKNWR